MKDLHKGISFLSLRFNGHKWGKWENFSKLPSDNLHAQHAGRIIFSKKKIPVENVALRILTATCFHELTFFF